MRHDWIRSFSLSFLPVNVAADEKHESESVRNLQLQTCIMSIDPEASFAPREELKAVECFAGQRDT